MKLLNRILFALPLSLMAFGCSSLNYGDPTEEETLTIDYGSTDLQTLAKGMVGDMETSPGLDYVKQAEAGADPRIVIYLDNIYNETREHINMGLLRDKIISELFENQRFRVVAGKLGQDEIGEQIRFQQGSGRVDPEQSHAFGRQVGADVVVYGAMRDITKQTGRSIESGGTKTKDVYYNLFLRMDNVSTAETVWAHDEEIRKREVVGLFGG